LASDRFGSKADIRQRLRSATADRSASAFSIANQFIELDKRERAITGFRIAGGHRYWY